MCTPGMIMSIYGHLAKGGKREAEESIETILKVADLTEVQLLLTDSERPFQSPDLAFQLQTLWLPDVLR